jgi:hypothetical protein
VSWIRGVWPVTPTVFLLLNLALAFYNVGTIWAHEVDIFRSWRMVRPEAFRRIQQAHWRKLPYWVLFPVALAFAGSIGLIWYHPTDAPPWGIWGAFGCLALSHVLTALFWGRWQAKLSTDLRGSASPYLDRILSTHWIRTVLITSNAVILLVWLVMALQGSALPLPLTTDDAASSVTPPATPQLAIPRPHPGTRSGRKRSP